MSRRKDQNLSPEVRRFEPPVALFSSCGGMTHIYKWFKTAMRLLTYSGVFIFEVGYNQSEKVRDFLDRQKTDYRIYKDFSDRFRTVFCRKL